MNTKFALILVTALAVACGGGAPTTTSRPSSQQSSQQSNSPTGPSQPTPGAPAPQPGESITGEQIVGAYTALNALDSWTFEATFWNRGAEKNFEQSVEGIQRQRPEVAIDSTLTSAGGPFRFIMIEDDIWADLASGAFYHYDAAGSENLIEQYTPFYIAALIGPVDSPRLDFDPIAIETLNGIATTHYTLSEMDRENAVQTLDIDPSLWAGDVWIANEGGYLVALAWGPQTLEDARPIRGFRYDVTSVNCVCLIEPPEESIDS